MLHSTLSLIDIVFTKTTKEYSIMVLQWSPKSYCAGSSPAALVYFVNNCCIIPYLIERIW